MHCSVKTSHLGSKTAKHSKTMILLITCMFFLNCKILCLVFTRSTLFHNSTIFPQHPCSSKFFLPETCRFLLLVEVLDDVLDYFMVCYWRDFKIFFLKKIILVTNVSTADVMAILPEFRGSFAQQSRKNLAVYQVETLDTQCG